MPWNPLDSSVAQFVHGPRLPVARASNVTVTDWVTPGVDETRSSVAGVGSVPTPST